MGKGPGHGGITKRIPRMLVPQSCREVEGGTMVTINPAENVIIGSQAICDYLGIHYNTLLKWVEVFGFPAIKRTDGRWMTTVTSIDQWIFMAADIENKVRKDIRGNRVMIDNTRYYHRMKDNEAQLEAARASKRRKAREGFQKVGNN